MKKISLTILCFVSFLYSHGQSETPTEVEDRPLNNSASADAYSWLSKDGLRIYYSRENSAGEFWKAERKSLSDAFINPVSLSIDGLTGDDEVFSCWLTEDEKTVFFATHQKEEYFSTTLYKASYNESTLSFTHPVKLNLTVGGLSDNSAIFVSGPSLTPDLKQLFVFYNDGHSFDQIACYTSTDGINYAFKSFLNNAENYSPGSLAHNGLSFYCTMNDQPNLLLKLTRPDITSEFGLPEYFTMDASVNGDRKYLQPSVNEDLRLISFTLGDGSWSGNDLVVVQSPLNKTTFIPYPANLIYGDSDSMKFAEIVNMERESEIKPDEKSIPETFRLEPAIERCGYFENPTPIDYDSQETIYDNELDVEDTLLFDPNDTWITPVSNPYSEKMIFEALPNPASSLFKIIYDFKSKGSESKKLVLINQTGQVVKQFEAHGKSGTIVVDITDLAEGIYYYKLFSDVESSPIKKLVVKH